MIQVYCQVIESFGYHIIKRMISSSNRAFIVKDNRGCVWFAKLKRYDDALKEQQLLESLRKFYVNTPQMYRILQNDNDSYCISLYEYITFSDVINNNVFNIGVYICSLHNALKNIEYQNVTIFDYFDYAYNTCIPYIRCCSKKLGNFINKCVDILILNSRVEMESQVIHGDLHNRNIYVCKNNKIGFLDFENCLKTYRIYDLSYYIVSLISVDTNIEYWLYCIENLVIGYTSLSNNEIDSIYNTMACIVIMKISFGLKCMHKELIEDAIAQLVFLSENRSQVIYLQKRLTCLREFNL